MAVRGGFWEMRFVDDRVAALGDFFDATASNILSIYLDGSR
jgi:hypothetical protein